VQRAIVVAVETRALHAAIDVELDEFEALARAAGAKDPGAYRAAT